MKSKKKKQISDIREVLAMLIGELRKQAVISKPDMDLMLACLYGDKYEK